MTGLDMPPSFHISMTRETRLECLHEHKMKSLCQLGQCTNLHQPQQTDTFVVYGIHRTKIHVTAAVMVPLTITPRPVIENTHRGKTSHERLREQMVHNSKSRQEGSHMSACRARDRVVKAGDQQIPLCVRLSTERYQEQSQDTEIMRRNHYLNHKILKHLHSTMFIFTPTEVRTKTLVFAPPSLSEHVHFITPTELRQTCLFISSVAQTHNQTPRPRTAGGARA